MALHEWTVASALIERDGHLLLVRNVRQGGSEDWSTPGGVIDADDHSIIDGLAREVCEETGLRVTEWTGPAYEVIATAHDLGWRMRCEVHHAAVFHGDLVIDDPDGIVVEADFHAPDRAIDLLAACPRWVREPISDWIAAPWPTTIAWATGQLAAKSEPLGVGLRRYEYVVHGTRRADLRVERI